MIHGGHGLELCTLNFIESVLPHGKSILEIGAGVSSTPYLSERYELHSIEGIEDFIDRNLPVDFIYAPLVNGWYDVEVLKDRLPGINYDLVVVDGPCGHRPVLLDNLDLFDLDSAFIIHDTWREKDCFVAGGLAAATCRRVQFFNKGDYWAYIKGAER